MESHDFSALFGIDVIYVYKGLVIPHPDGCRSNAVIILMRFFMCHILRLFLSGESIEDPWQV